MPNFEFNCGDEPEIVSETWYEMLGQHPIIVHGNGSNDK